MKIPQNGVSGVISAHSVDAAAGRGGGRTEIHPFLWGPIGDYAERRSGEHLPEMVSSARDSSSDQIRVHFFQLRGQGDLSRQDSFTETRGKTIDLSFHDLRQVPVRPERHMSIGPEHLLPGRRSS